MNSTGRCFSQGQFYFLFPYWGFNYVSHRLLIKSFDEFIVFPLFLFQHLSSDSDSGAAVRSCCSCCNSGGQQWKVTCRPQLFNTACPHDSVCLLMSVRFWASVWGGTGATVKLMQRDEAKFTPWNIYQRRPGNDISPNFHTHPLPQRAKGQCSGRVCIKWCLPIQRLLALLSWRLFLLFVWTEKVLLKREMVRLNVRWEEQISSA